MPIAIVSSQHVPFLLNFTANKEKQSNYI